MDEDALSDLFSSLNNLSFRKMFGGYSVYSNGLVFAVVVRGDLMLKGDPQTVAAYEAAQMERWVEIKKKTGKQVAMPFWRVSDEMMDSADEMAPFARLAYEAALRAQK